MKPIGGYFELELHNQQKTYHPNANLALKSGRTCIQILLEQELPNKVWIPYYTCDALIEPLEKYNINYDFYTIDKNLEISNQDLTINNDEILIYVNYFGIKDLYIRKLEQIYQNKLWLDHTQAFFYKPKTDLSYHFNSARKFFGVPDGAYLYIPRNTNFYIIENCKRNQNYRFEHLLFRYQGNIEEGYPIFQENEKLNGGEISYISYLSEIVLSQIDYNEVTQKRRKNYLYLHKILGKNNQLSPEITNLSDDIVPFCYPYLPEKKIEHQYFWKKNIFVPIFWKECFNRLPLNFNWEKYLTANLLPLPIDHRYDFNDMDIVIESIVNYGK